MCALDGDFNLGPPDDPDFSDKFVSFGPPDPKDPAVWTRIRELAIEKDCEDYTLALMDVLDLDTEPRGKPYYYWCNPLACATPDQILEAALTTLGVEE